ncbi:hypothetical protein BGZ83_005480 [Gryganskiella cystojenkinii]|nr:hypothetical protein BGZ83_005480 [Gryganskiella cystojenkinii]
MAKLEKIVKNDTAASTATASKNASASVTKRTTRNTTSKPEVEEIEDDDEELEDKDEEDDDSDSDGSDSSDIDDIPDLEKMRIIRESGIMDQVQANEVQQQQRGSRRSRRRDGDNEVTEEEENDDANRDYIFEGIFFSIPTTCLFVVMDILVHRQFGETYGAGNVFSKVVKVFPAILFMVYFSNKAKAHPVTQGSMFVVSTACGCYFLHTMFRSPAMGIMLRAPGIITILVYCIVQLNLLPAVISLALCGLYYQYGNVKYHH